MELELLDELEDKVDVAVNAVNELRMENELLKEDKAELEKKIAKLSKDLEVGAESLAEAKTLRARVSELEEKLDGVRTRVATIVAKMKTVEG